MISAPILSPARQDALAYPSILEKTAIAIPKIITRPAAPPGLNTSKLFKNEPQNRGALGGPPAVFSKPLTR
jgi:hypothetical protein